MTASDVHGPIDTTIIEFPAGATGAATADALRDLVDSGLIRLYDIAIVAKDDDGNAVAVDLGSTAAGDLTTFGGAASGLIDDDDLASLADIIQPGCVGAALVYENAWAAPFVAAARSEGAEVVASARLSAQEIMDALDASEATA
jgi:uncharacterized membrane protein